MGLVDYHQIGNIKEYKHEQREVVPAGLVKSPYLILKMYNMITKEKPVNPVEDAKEFLIKEIRDNNLKSFIGLEFVILSKDMLNVRRWDSDYPIVLKNQLYEYVNFDFISKLSIDEAGPFCIWELGIVNHEKEAWKKYLTSSRTNGDKKRYLENFIEGRL